ncbi:pilus assembly protein TadG-related protein [Hansschlegelia beijingensis]|uniref:TadE/TadG family type IV pilus assembly protein n=1 Tax=Hansschlegelia beijingensis TaxID=1133344 RepID=UPI00387F2604
MLSRFSRSEKGAVAPLIAIVMLVLIGCMGFAIDVGRSVLVRARLVDALDSAGLAVGARLSTTDYSADARKFVNANFRDGYAGATVTKVTATANSTKSVISLSATATVPTIFMKLFGQKSVTVNATSEVTRSSSGLELVMVLDNTISMDMSGSMPSLRRSANDLLDILFGGESVGTNLYVGLVPFSQAVNVGTSRNSWFTGTKPFFGWTGCAMARNAPLDQTDDPPATNATKFSYPDFLKALTTGFNSSCPKEVTPLTNVKSTVTSAVNAMTASGYTHINLGAVWGWRMLSPRWRGYWGSSSLPLDYGTKNMSKAAVIMTDGDNTVTNYSAYGELPEKKLGTDNANLAPLELNKRLTAVCSSMKSAGIIIYTVAFDNPDAATKSLMQNCATSAAYYFDAGNQAALNTAFRTIGDSLSNLRVSK